MYTFFPVQYIQYKKCVSCNYTSLYQKVPFLWSSEHFLHLRLLFLKQRPTWWFSSLSCTFKRLDHEPSKHAWLHEFFHIKRRKTTKVWPPSWHIAAVPRDSSESPLHWAWICRKSNHFGLQSCPASLALAPRPFYLSFSWRLPNLEKKMTYRKKKKKNIIERFRKEKNRL